MPTTVKPASVPERTASTRSPGSIPRAAANPAETRISVPCPSGILPRTTWSRQSPSSAGSDTSLPESGAAGAPGKRIVTSSTIRVSTRSTPGSAARRLAITSGAWRRRTKQSGNRAAA